MRTSVLVALIVIAVILVAVAVVATMRRRRAGHVLIARPAGDPRGRGDE